MLSISSILDMLVSLKINSTIELFSLYCVTVSLLLKFLIVDNRGSIVTCRTYSLSAVYMGVGSMSNRPNGDAIVSERVELQYLIFEKSNKVENEKKELNKCKYNP